MIEITQIQEDALFEEAATVIRTAFRDTKEKNNVVFTVSDVDGAELKRIIEEKHGVCYAAWKDNAIAGTLSIVRQDVNKWYSRGEALKIRLVAVLPRYYGEHIGSQLVSRAVAYSRENRYDSVIVQTPANNIPAQRMYEKLDFVKVRYWRNRDHDVIDYVCWNEGNKPSRARCGYEFFVSRAITELRKIKRKLFR